MLFGKSGFKFYVLVFEGNTKCDYSEKKKKEEVAYNFKVAFF